ncbi:hypothetical protein H6G36_30385 [Anabaena minutissima FACHB-250]|nr:hypothetical protein [Anabaena minutissima FACHB-250]
MKKLLLLSYSLVLFSALPAKSQQNVSQSTENGTQRQNLFLATSGTADRKISEALSLFNQGYESYRSGKFEEAERSLKQIISGTFKEEFDQPPNLKIPKPGGLKESRFRIPFIFEYYSSYTVPSQVEWMEPQRRVAFDNLFAAVTARIARSPSSLELSNLSLPILNRLGGCIYYGNSGSSTCHQWNRPGTSPLQSIFGKDASRLFDNLPEMDEISKRPVEGFNSASNIHSISKNTLNLLQKSLIAHGGDKNFEEALIFAEQSRNMDLTRIGMEPRSLQIRK